MIIQFRDKGACVKHLCTIVSAKKIDNLTMQLTETLGQSLCQDLLHYEKAAILAKDLQRLAKELEKYSMLVNAIEQEQKRIGFQPDAVNQNEIEPDPE